MRRRDILPSAAALIFFLASAARAQRVVFVVRHAEKASEANDASVQLSPAGIERAKRLAGMLQDSGISAIYSTDFVRTRGTVQPLSQILKLPIEIYAPQDAQGKPSAAPLLQRIAQDRKEDIVLVVGHADTVPVILKGLGCVETVSLAGNEYDNLFLVVPSGPGPPILLRLRY